MKTICNYCIERSRCEGGLLECTESMKRRAKLERRRSNLKGWLKEESGETDKETESPQTLNNRT